MGGWGLEDGCRKEPRGIAYDYNKKQDKKQKNNCHARKIPARAHKRPHVQKKREHAPRIPPKRKTQHLDALHALPTRPHLHRQAKKNNANQKKHTPNNTQPQNMENIPPKRKSKIRPGTRSRRTPQLQCRRHTTIRHLTKTPRKTKIRWVRAGSQQKTKTNRQTFKTYQKNKTHKTNNKKHEGP